VAKIIAMAPTRNVALKKIKAALEMTTIVGIKTNLPLHLGILANADFLEGKYDTTFLEKYFEKEASANGETGVAP